MRWTFGYPELKHLSWIERQKLVGEVAHRKYLYSYAMPCSVFVLIAGFSSWLPVIFFPRYALAVSVRVIIQFSMMGIGLTGAAVMGYLTFQENRMAVQKLCVERGIRPLNCFQCAYDLSHLETAVCPECGCRIERCETETESPSDMTVAHKDRPKLIWRSLRVATIVCLSLYIALVVGFDRYHLRHASQWVAAGDWATLDNVPHKSSYFSGVELRDALIARLSMPGALANPSLHGAFLRFSDEGELTQGLLDAAADPKRSLMLRSNAISMLSVEGKHSDQIIRAMIALLKEVPPDAIHTSIIVLLNLRSELGEQYIPLLLPLLEHEDPQVRQTAMDILSRMNGRAKGALDALRAIRDRGDRNSEDSRSARRAIESIEAPQK